MAFLDKPSGTEKELDNRIASFFMNVLRIRNANDPDASGAIKEGAVKATFARD